MPTNEESAKAGIAVVHASIETFNAQDHERHAETLNYPHVRFANGRLSIIENGEVFMAGSRRGEGRLQQQGWHLIFGFGKTSAMISNNTLRIWIRIK
jgi:hypothetical protein